MKIRVTKTNIKKGRPSSPCDCPIALALKRMGLTKIDVDHWRVSYYRGEVVHVLVLPEKARRFIRAFDRGAEVSPFTFELEETPF